LAFQHGSEFVGMSVSDHWTNEEIFTVKRFADDVIKTPHLFSLNNPAKGLADVLGLDASPNTMDELLRTQVILLIGSSIMRDHTIAGLKIKEAVKENGARLVTINPESTKADEWAALKVQPDNQVAFLKEIAAALIQSGAAPKMAEGLESLKESLESITISDQAQQVADMYQQAKSAMIVFDQQSVTPEAAQMIANLAVLSGHIGKPRRGILQLKAQNNSQAVSLMNITGTAGDLDRLLSEHQLKALLVFGEDYPVETLKELDFLMVMDTHLTPTALMADVVLPAASMAESRGSYISTERRIQKLTQAVSPLQSMENWQVIDRMAAILRMPFNYTSTQKIAHDLSVGVDGFESQQSQDGEAVFWPVGQSPILYEDAFSFENGKARLIPVTDTVLFQKGVSTHYVTNTFMKYLQEEGLDRK
jgi:formate dehydrogenase major subunit